MSLFSGKCDCWDSFIMIHCDGYDEEQINKEIERTDFYIYHGGKNHRLDIHILKDLVPYFPYIVASGYFNRDDNRQSIHLSSESWVDHEEKEHLGWILRDAKKEYRKCKRNKIPFDPDTWVDKSHWMNNEIKREIAKRVAENGEKADIEDIHIPSYDRWDRKRLAEEMSKFGYSDFEISRWVYQGRNYNWKTEED